MHYLIPFELRVKSNVLIAFSVVYAAFILILVTNFSLMNSENDKNFAYGFKSQTVPPSTTSPPPPANNVTSTQQFQPSSPPPPANNVTSTQQFQPSSPPPPANNVTSTQQFQRQETVKPVIPIPKAPKGPPASFQAKGTINSVIAVPKKNWIATGNWIITVNYGNLTGFKTNMSWVDQTGTATHTHEFLNFRPSPAFHVIVQQPNDTILVRGQMDVGTNSKVVWKDVPSVISIKGGKTISISVNDKATNSHFASQPILGVVKSFERCSDIPGPDMVVLPSCT
jgi:hypothetical protein